MAEKEHTRRGEESSSGQHNRPQRRFQLPLIGENENKRGDDRGRNPAAFPSSSEAVIRANLDAARTRLNGDSNILPHPPAREENIPTAGGENPARQTASPLAASVRIRIRDGGGSNYGSGTVIDSRPGSALVLTCGHLFRNVAASAVIEVDVFDQQTVKKYPGRLLTCDLKADVGLIALRPQHLLPFVRLAPRNESARQGDSLLAIGCGGGRPPLQMAVRVTALNRYLGPENIECTGVPQQGRSGGGLFNQRGELVGVCFAADPPRGRGLYAGLQPIYELLQEAGIRMEKANASLAANAPGNTGNKARRLNNGKHSGTQNRPAESNGNRKGSAVFPVAASADSADAGSFDIAVDRNQLSQMQQAADDGKHFRAAVPSSGTEASSTSGAGENRMSSGKTALPGGVASTLSRVDAVFGRDGEAEVICIIRPLNQPRSASQVVVIHRASSKFVKYLRNELNHQPRPTSQFVPAQHSVQRASPLHGEWSADRNLPPKVSFPPASERFEDALRQAAREDNRPGWQPEERVWQPIERGRYRRSPASRR